MEREDITALATLLLMFMVALGVGAVIEDSYNVIPDKVSLEENCEKIEWQKYDEREQALISKTIVETCVRWDDFITLYCSRPNDKMGVCNREEMCVDVPADNVIDEGIDKGGGFGG